MKINLPKIKVGYQDISVVITNDRDDGRLEDSQGFYSSSQAKIVISDKQCLTEQIATLFHELFHAAFYVYGMKEIIEDKEREEYIVNTLSSAMLHILKDNPVLLKLVNK